MRVERYEISRQETWSHFVSSSKNGNFLFDRRYMEYHADRFNDYSLLFFDERDRLVGLLPASINGTTVVSHGGLTYGGVVCTSDMKTAAMLELFSVMREFMRRDGIRCLVYKPVPHIFHVMPADEDLYALYRNNAKLLRRDASSAIYLPERMKFAKGKREGIRRAVHAGLEVRESQDYASFFEMGRAVMRDRHNLAPVHTAEEMGLLASRFPGKIRLHASFLGDRMLAGAICYVYATAVHLQYMYNSDEGLGVGALDVVLDRLINEEYSTLRYFSFGVSTEDDGRYLNEGLIHQKEMFGARSVVHDFYEVDLT